MARGNIEQAASVFVTIWQRSWLGKARIVLAFMLLFCAVIGVGFSPPVWWAYFSGSMAFTNIILVFWPKIRGVVSPVTHFYDYQLVIRDGGKLTIMDPLEDGEWVTFQFTKPVAEWCRDFCQDRCGIRTQKLGKFDTGQRTIWFENPDDAFAFRMRWGGTQIG